MSLSEDNYGTLWDATTGRLLANLGGEGAVQDADILDDTRRVFTNSYDSTGAVWDANTIADPGDVSFEKSGAASSFPN